MTIKKLIIEQLPKLKLGYRYLLDDDGRTHYISMVYNDNGSYEQLMLWTPTIDNFGNKYYRNITFKWLGIEYSILTRCSDVLSKLNEYKYTSRYETETPINPFETEITNIDYINVPKVITDTLPKLKPEYKYRIRLIGHNIVLEIIGENSSDVLIWEKGTDIIGIGHYKEARPKILNLNTNLTKLNEEIKQWKFSYLDRKEVFCLEKEKND